MWISKAVERLQAAADRTRDELERIREEMAAMRAEIERMKAGGNPAQTAETEAKPARKRTAKKAGEAAGKTE